MPTFRYDEATHQYSLLHESGRVEILPSVTQIIDSAGLINEFSKQEFAAHRGLRAHEAARYIFEGRLDWSSVDNRIEGYCRSLEQWIKITGFVAERCEARLYHPELLFAGSFDVCGYMPDGASFILDLKTSLPAEWHPIQLGGYLILLGGYRRRGGLYLKRDGEIAQFESYDDPMDMINFISLLNVWRLREKLSR